MDDRTMKSRSMLLLVWGDNACFTRPEMKVERVSYDVMPPSAARGVLEAIIWKPAMRWVIERIDVLKPIRWDSVRRNEVGIKMSPRSKGLYIEDQRQQRAGMFLREVEYLIHAHLELTSKAGRDDTMIKFQEMFIRRSAQGQCFHRPYLGCREFAAEFAYLPHDARQPEAIAETRDLGFMLYDMDFSKEMPMPMWFRAQLDRGRLRIPSLESGEVHQ